MSDFKTESAKKIHGLPVAPRLSKEIEQALEMMRRVRAAQLAQDNGEAAQLPRTKFVIPKPLVYPVTRSSNRQ
jgi:hypothetical protein